MTGRLLLAIALAFPLPSVAAPAAPEDPCRIVVAPGAVPSDEQAQRAHACGQCGSLGPGTGLTVTPYGSSGWVVSMLPGPHEFRIVGVGTVGVTVAKRARLDFDAGRPYYITIDGSAMQGRLEWKVPGSDWGPVSRLFLYPDDKKVPGGAR